MLTQFWEGQGLSCPSFNVEKSKVDDNDIFTNEICVATERIIDDANLIKLAFNIEKSAKAHEAQPLEKLKREL